MTGMVIRLRPHEKMLLNGVVLQNGDRVAQIRVRTKGVSILRLRDALHPCEADTPLRRIYYAAQLALTGEANADDAARAIAEGLGAFKPFAAPEAAALVRRALEANRARKFFVVMRALKKMFPHEDRVLGRGRQ